MPASAGRVRMPHNNRMQTSGALKTSAIWQKTIGHDPYAGSDEPNRASSEQESEQAREKARQVMNVARQQNLTGGGGDHRDDFAQKMYLGLKHSKKRSSRHVDGDGQIAAVGGGEQCHDKNTLSSSEDEFVEVQISKEPSSSKNKKKHKKNRKKKKSRQSRYSSDDDDDDDSSEPSRKLDRRRQKKQKDKSKNRKRRRDSSSDDETSESDSSSSSSRGDRKNKRKDRKKERRTSKKSTREVSRGGRRHEEEKPKIDQPTTFIASELYNGSRHGYVFQMGKQGLGYYRNNPPIVNERERDAMLELYS